MSHITPTCPKLRADVHIHPPAEVFRERFDVVLVNVLKENPRQHAREDLPDCPRHRHPHSEKQMKRLLTPVGMEGTFHQPDEGVRQCVRSYGLANNARPVVIVDDCQDTDRHTIPVFRDRIIVQCDMS